MAFEIRLQFTGEIVISHPKGERVDDSLIGYFMSRIQYIIHQGMGPTNNRTLRVSGHRMNGDVRWSSRVNGDPVENRTGWGEIQVRRNRVSYVTEEV